MRVNLTEDIGLVWCERYGDTHPHDSPDYFGEGPLRPDAIDDYEKQDPAWVYHEEPHKGFSGGLYHYVCPGPHYKLWAGAEIKPASDPEGR